MIHLTPLDVRKKRGDFKRLMRGYDPGEVDLFLEVVAERMEELVRENLQFRERTETLQQQVTSQLGRERAVQDALVTAQELRADIQAQTEREAGHIIKEAEAEARRIVAEADGEARKRTRAVERRLDGASDTLVVLERRRARFLRDFRALLERELDGIAVEESREPLEDRATELQLGGTRASEPPRSDEVEPTGAGSAEGGLEGATPMSEGRPAATGSESAAPPESAQEVELAEGAFSIAQDTGSRPSGIPAREELAAFEAEAVAEAGAELVDAEGEDVSATPRSVEEISPPPITGRRDDALLLYLDSDESER